MTKLLTEEEAAILQEQPEETEPEETEPEETEPEETEPEETEPESALPPTSPAGSSTASGVSTQFVSRVKEVIIASGGTGLTAKAIAIAVGVLSSDSLENTQEFKDATRRVRQAARKAVDTTPGGSRNVREGKNTVYKIISE